MTQIDRPKRLYQGHTYHKLSREYQRYKSDPHNITPLQLLEWAMDVGQWSLHERDDSPQTMWYGPYGNPPIIGTELSRFLDRNTALSHMRGQYVEWWTQKTQVEEAFKLLRTYENSCNCEHDQNHEEDDEDDPEYS